MVNLRPVCQVSYIDGEIESVIDQFFGRNISENHFWEIFHSRGIYVYEM